MRSLTIALLLVLTAASPKAAPSHEKLMDAIERMVILPGRAQPLADYGRNYALIDKDHVLGIYLIPPRPYETDLGCVHGNGVPCSKSEIEESIRANEVWRSSQAKAGEHRWFEDAKELPYINDGGCNQITVEYYIPTASVSGVSCNGRG